MRPVAQSSKAARVSVLELSLNLVAWDELLRFVLDAAAGTSRRSVMYLNAHTCNLACCHTEMREALCSADIVYCDGAGVRLAAHILGAPLPPRATAADFMPDLARECSRRGIRVYLLGGLPGVAQQAGEELKRIAPGLRIVGTHDGYFFSPSDGTGGVIDSVNRAGPGILFVGLGSPLQETWLCKHRQAINAPVVWCVGAAMDFVSGRCPRAPKWMRDRGLEWLFRLVREPRRLFVRYVVGNPLFVLRLLAYRLRLRGRTDGAEQAAPKGPGSMAGEADVRR